MRIFFNEEEEEEEKTRIARIDFFIINSCRNQKMCFFCQIKLFLSKENVFSDQTSDRNIDNSLFVSKLFGEIFQERI